MSNATVTRKHRELVTRIFGEDPNVQGESSPEEFARQQIWLETGIENRELDEEDAATFKVVTNAVQLVANFEAEVRDEQLLADYQASKIGQLQKP